MRIVGICRYSLLGRGDWHAYRGKTDAEVEAVAKEQAKLLFAKDRMNARLESFEHLTLASLRAQTDQDYTFIVLASEMMPKIYRDKLLSLCKDMPNVLVRFFPLSNAIEAQAKVYTELGLTYRDTVQFRLDDDDCLCRTFIQMLRYHAEKFDEPLPFAISVSSFLYAVSGGSGKGVYDWQTPFLGAGAAVWHPHKSIYAFGHFALGVRFPYSIIEGHQALVTNTGLNDTEATAEKIMKAGMIRLNTEQIMEDIDRDFPFLSQKAFEITGMPLQVSLMRKASEVRGMPMPQRRATKISNTKAAKTG